MLTVTLENFILLNTNIRKYTLEGHELPILSEYLSIIFIDKYDFPNGYNVYSGQCKVNYLQKLLHMMISD